MKTDVFTIGQVCKRFSSGKFISADNISDTGTYPVYGGNGFRGYASIYNFDGECSIIGRQGAYCGNVRYFNGKGYMTDHAVVAVTTENHCNRYLSYKLGLADLGRFSGQAAQPGLSVTKIARLRLEMPSLPIQQKIASILSTYDNLIENNTKRIKLLEQMAENLYKEWFVRFRFPGHEKVEMENGLPKGWKIERLDSVVEVCYGKDHKKISDGDIPVYGSGGVMRYGDKFLFDGETVLIPRKGSLNNVMYCNGKIWTVDTMFYTKMLLPNLAKYFYYTISKIDLASFNSGAALPSMTTDILYHFKLVIPTCNVLELFNEKVSLLNNQMNILNQQSQLLTRQRDLLLPRLMSGRLEVKP